MTLRLKKNHAIMFIAPNIRLIKPNRLPWGWYKIEGLDFPSALSTSDWEEVREKGGEK